MDYALKSRMVNAVSEILDTVSQQPVDLDFTLPDYCADMEKILKCTLDVKIYTRNISAGQLRIDGASVVRILYLDSNKTILRCCEQTLPFSATFPVNSQLGVNVILASAKPEYLNCRALSPRRVSVHGAFSLHACVLSRVNLDLFEETSEPALQVMPMSSSVCELCDFSQDQFSLSETVSLSSKSIIESIVRSELTATLTDCKPAGDKYMIKGEITLRMLYICDSATGETDRFVYVFPFTQMLDKGESDCEIADVRLSVLSHELLLKSEPLSEDPVVGIDAKLCATVMGYNPREVTYISDAYSTDCITEPEYDFVELCTNILPVSVNTMSKSTLSLGDVDVQKILDIFTENPTADAEIKDSSLNFSGKVNVCILAYTQEGELIAIERSVEFAHQEMLHESFSAVKSLSAQVTSISYRLGDGNEIELRFELKLSAQLSSCESIRQVKFVKTVADSELPSNRCALTLYYAQAGEKVWDIAKRYNASMESLCSENSLSEDTLQACGMLLIPHV